MAGDVGAAHRRLHPTTVSGPLAEAAGVTADHSTAADIAAKSTGPG
jgi:hypothetical protein